MAKWRIRKGIAGMVFSFSLLLTGTVQGQDDGELARGRQLTRWLQNSAIDSLLPALSPEFAAAVGGRAGVENMPKQVEAQLGRETELVEEAIYREAGHISYYRIARHEKLPSNTITTRWVWRESDGVVMGAQLTPTPRPAPTEHADYMTKAALRLPFDGEWYVAWGGREPHRNYHVIAPDQRFAYDFLIMRDGATRSGAGRDNSDYFCFGQPVLAPAAGSVVTVLDTVADNVPGQMNRNVPAGNHIVIDHGNGEYSLLAHFRRGSITIRAGDRVAPGQRLGECGNSGNSSEPHVHFHLQTGGAYREGVGLPAFFRDYLADGEPVERGEPQRGQIIRNRQ